MPPDKENADTDKTDKTNAFTQNGLEGMPGKSTKPSELSAAKTPAASTAIPLSQLHVLLAEDDIISQKIAAHIFTELQCRCDIVTNGRQVLEKLDSGRYDIIFMDCQMPELDGWETTRLIRQRQGTDRHITIIALTANAMLEDQNKCREAGMNDFLTKPIHPEKMIAALTRHCRIANNHQQPHRRR